MRKFYTLLWLLFITGSTNLFAQTNWNFAAPTDGSGGGTAPENGKGLCTDASGNVYMVGMFNGNADFDLNSASTNTYTSTGNDGFISSYDKNGNFRWKVVVSGPGSDFNTYLTGVATNGTYVWFAGSANFTSGAPQVMSNTNTVTVTDPGATTTDAFVAKLNCSNGAVQWATGFGGTTNNDAASGLAIDPTGCCYTIGVYGGAFTSGSVSAPAPSGSSDLFVAKLNTNGTLRAFRSGGSTGGDMQFNGGGICYAAGASPAIVAVGSAQFGGGTATYGSFNITLQGLNDGMLLELDTALTNFTNAIGIGTANNEELEGAVYDSYSGGVYVSGFFNNASVTVPGAGTVTNAGGEDMFVARYSVSGDNFTWAKSAGGTGNERAYSIAADGYGGIVIGGESSSTTCTFSGSVSVTPTAGVNDIVVAHYNTSGVPAWALTSGGTGGDDCKGIACYVETTPSYIQNVYITGNFQNTVTFNTTTLTADGGAFNNFFLARINDAATPLTATQSQVNLTCNSVCTGSATVVASGGVPPYTYSWSPYGGSGATASSLCAGSFTCTITDATSVSITKVFSITQPTAIVLNANSQTNVSCFGGSNGAASVVAASGGTGGYTYNWTPGNPTGDGTTSVTGLTAGTWTCTVTDANGCTATRTFNITQPTALSVTVASQTNVSCFGGSNGAASINIPTGGAGGYTYNWTPGNPTGDGTTSVTGLTATTWTCTVTDANSCTSTATFNLTSPTAISVTPASQTNISCFGGSNGAASINTPTGGAGGYTYNWTPGNPTGDGTVSVTGLTATTWTCTVTDANGCTATQLFNLTSPTALSLNALSQTNISCFGGSNGAACVSPATGGAGAYTYNWTPGNPTGDGTTCVSGLTATTWTCTVTDANGCTTTRTFNITSPTAISVTPVSQTNIACNGGSNGAASVSASGGAGGYTYNWTPGNPTGDGTVSVTGLTAGSWTCTVTDANSCTNTATFNITSPSAISVTPASQTNVSCFGGSNGAASINTPTGGAGGYTYNWTPGNPTGDGTVSVTGLTAGSWTCTVTDANSCTNTATFNITAPTAISVTPASQTNVSCFGGSNGAASINTPTGGAGGYTYNWTPGNPTGDGTVSVTGLTATTWTCTVTDANSCTSSATFNVTSPSALSVTPASQTNISCFGGSNGAASINMPTGGAGGYTYNWTPGNPTGDGTVSVTGLIAGSWTCTVTDANSCTNTATFNITAPTAISVTPASQTNVSCFGGSNGAASINTPTGGAGGYTYNWTPGNPTGDGTVAVSGLTATSWTCTVTDANSCTSTATFNITSPSALSVTPSSQTNVSCNGGSNGAASINTPTGGAGGYTYNWTPGNPTGDGTVAVSGLNATTWTCTVTDANSCTSTATFNITQPTAITASISSTPTSCSSSTGTATVSSVTGGTGAYTYAWTPSGGTGSTASSLGTNTYSCTITDANGCTLTKTVNVTTAAGPTLTASSQTNVLCNGGNNGAASVNAASGGTGPYTYDWTPGNPAGDGTVSVTGLTAGTWSCTVTDAGGCTATQTFNITAPSSVSVTVVSQTNVSCNGGSDGSGSVSASGGAGSYTYSWTPSGGTSASTGNFLPIGSYTCNVTDGNGCTSSASITVTEPTVVSIATSSTSVLCNGGNDGTATAAVSGGTPPYTYNWSPSGGNAAVASGLIAGTYSCDITDFNGCFSTVTVTVTEPTVLSSTSASTDVSCNGGADGTGSVTVSGGTGPYSYSWSPSGGSGPFATGLTAGTYTITTTDANSCTTSVTLTVTEPTAISVTETHIDVSCNGGSDGSIDLTVSGGVGPYTFSWNNSATTEDISGLTAGTYTGTLTDANGCTSSGSITITEPSAISSSAVLTDPTSCTSNDGMIDQTISGGTAGYTFVWSNAATTEDISSLDGGTYSVTITDANGCTGTAAYTLTEPGAPTVTYTDPIDSACQTTTLPFSLSGESPSGGMWSGPGVTGSTFDPMSANIGYNLITYAYTDVNGCSGSATDSIYVDLCMSLQSIASSNEITLYPNPTSGLLNIVLPSGTTDIHITCFTSDGRIVKDFVITNQNTTSLDLANEANGIYSLRIVSGEYSRVYKVVKQN